MPKVKKNFSNKKVSRAATSSIYLKRNQSSKSENQSLLQKIQAELQLNMSYLNLALGLLIVLVALILLFNYFKKGQQNLGPAQQTVSEEQSQVQKNVEPANLPGKYTVKDGDTLFAIAQNYYQDGYKFGAITKANSLTNPDVLEVGQVLDIPKLEEEKVTTAAENNGTGGAINETAWGEKINGDSYTVVEDDWLSKIAGRAYGDVMAYERIAQANNISNPDLIEPGMVLKIPR